MQYTWYDHLHQPHLSYFVIATLDFALLSLDSLVPVQHRPRIAEGLLWSQPQVLSRATTFLDFS